MIVEGLISIVVGLVDLILDAMGTGAAPGWLTGLGAQMNQLVSYASEMGSWVPWGSITTAIGAVMAAALVSFGVRMVRMLVSLFTGGGGSAA